MQHRDLGDCASKLSCSFRAGNVAATMSAVHMHGFSAHFLNFKILWCNLLFLRSNGSHYSKKAWGEHWYNTRATGKRSVESASCFGTPLYREMDKSEILMYTGCFRGSST